MKLFNRNSKSALYRAPLAVGLATAMSLSACSKKDQPTTFSQQDARALVSQAAKLRAEGKVAEADLKSKEAADHYARLGELLLMPEGVMYADEMFGKALELDPTNAKANLLKSATEPMMTLRGFIPKFERILTDRESNEAVERLRQEIAKLKMPEVSQFSQTLGSGDAPMYTVYEAQRFLREKFLPAVLASIDKLSRIDASQGIVLNVTPERMAPDPRRDSSYSYSYNCYNDSYKGWTCNSDLYHYETKKLPNQQTLDATDIKLIQHGWMAIADGIRLGTAFSLKDVEFVVRRLQAIDDIRRHDVWNSVPGTFHYGNPDDLLPPGNALSARDVVEVVRSFPDFLTLEKDQQLAELAQSTPKAVKLAYELATMREQYCDRPTRNADNALFTPICVSADVTDALRLSLDMLSGPKEVDLVGPHGHGTKILMDVTRVLKNPPKDLKALLPTKFDEQGNATNLPDGTMGGLFPNGDFLEKLKEIGAWDNAQPEIKKSMSNAIQATKGHI